MEIIYWAIGAFITWLIVAIAFIRACIKSDKETLKAIDDDYNQIVKGTFLVPDDIPEEELGVLCCEQPFIYLPDGSI